MSRQYRVDTKDATLESHFTNVEFGFAPFVLSRVLFTARLFSAAARM